MDSQRRDSQRRDSQKRKGSTDSQGKKGGTRSVGFWVEGQCLYPGSDSAASDWYVDDSYPGLGMYSDPRRVYDRLTVPDSGHFISGRALLAGQRSPNTILR